MRKPSSSLSLPAPGQGKRGESGYLGYLLRQAAGAYRHAVERALADLEVTPPQFTVLTMLAAYPGLSSADLARLALLTPQTISVIVANLEKAGLVTRKPHAVHGRISQLDITVSGRSLLRICRRRVHAIEADLVKGLPAAEEQAVRHWLVRVATSDTAKQDDKAGTSAALR
jgi:DNA-binding MarR family transcriptional regulator